MARRYRVIATFNGSGEAEAALADLYRRGYAADQVAVLLADRSRGRHFVFRARHRLPQGAALGGLLGGAAGAIGLGVAAALGGSLPGLAELANAAAGPTLVAFVGAGGGGLLGWVVGALIGLGYDDHEAALSDGHRSGDGHILLGVEADSEDRATVAEQIFARDGATRVAS